MTSSYSYGPLSGLSAGISGDLTAPLPGGNPATVNIVGGTMIGDGHRFEGNLASGGTDHLTVQLVAGKSYVFRLWGTDGSNKALIDPMLVLRDPQGNAVASNDDVDGSNQFSLIKFTATKSGTYTLDVSGHGGGGHYAIDMSGNVLTPEQVAVQLTEFGWGIPTEIAFDAQPGDTLSVNLNGLTAGERQMAQWALDLWSSYSGLRFVTTSGSADITFDDSDGRSGSYAYAGPTSYYPSTGEILGSQVIISSAWSNAYGDTVNSYSLLTYLHEIGHALGLTHAGNYDGGASYGADNYYLNDSTQISIMSYFSPDENGFIHDALTYAITPMIADVLAIWELYGTPSAIEGGDTVWGRNSTVSGILGTLQRHAFGGAAPNSAVWDSSSSAVPIAMTIIDTGGIDRLDLSGETANQFIDLNPGAVSDIGGESGNLVIGTGTVIEMAFGGSGSDRIQGNFANNTLNGGSGADLIYGANGNDKLNGGGQADWMYGGNGRDELRGGNGNDGLRGGDGADTLYGGNGHDNLRGGNQNDLLDGGEGNDTLDGEAGRDELRGSTGNDVLMGSQSSDLLYGGDGNDVLNGGWQSDWLYGGNGRDELRGGAGADFLRGGDGADALWGGDGGDDLRGGNQNDSLNGGAGNDRLDGEAGDDVMTGSGGADVFVFGPGGGNDVVTDFRNGTDRLDLRAFGLGFADLRAAASDHAGDLLIDFGGGNSLLIEHFSLAQFDAGDLF